MNRDMIILLKSIYKNTIDRNQYNLRLDEIMATFNKNKLRVKQLIAVEERLLKDKVSEVKHLFFFNIAVCDIGLFSFLFR